MKAKFSLISAKDGPECIDIYINDDQGVIDWTTTFPSLYLEASINGSYVKLGPFTLVSIYEQLVTQLIKVT